MAEFVVDFYSEHDGVRCEEVVRCRDCKHFAADKSDHVYRSGWRCKRWDTDMVEPTGFCKWGERRAES